MPIIRHLFSHEYGPFDRFVELGVFLFIATEGLIALIVWNSHRRQGKKMARLKERDDRIFRSIPNDDSSAEVNEAWMRTANAWTKDASDWFRSRSAYAVEVFLRDEGTDIVASRHGLKDEQLRSAVRTFGYRHNQFRKALSDL